MSVLDAARRLAEADLAEQWEPDTDYLGCPWCCATIGAASYSRDRVEAHDATCPWLQITAIIRALETAERLTAESPYYDSAICVFCETNGIHGHDPACLWHAFVGALSGAAGGGPDDQTAGP